MTKKSNFSQPLSKELCEKWNSNKFKNPITNYKIKETGKLYKELKRDCPKIMGSITKKQPLSKELCEKWNSNKFKNPITNYKIKENGITYNNIKNECKYIFDTENVSKIKKHVLPFIKRISPNIVDRINYYLIIHKYILNIQKKYKNNCMRIYKITDDGKIIYRIGNYIVLDKKIGMDSKYGIVFLAHYIKSLMYKFAVKITEEKVYNKTELLVLQELTKCVINFDCPHFPITYGILYCSNKDLCSVYNSTHLTNNSDINKLNNDTSKFPLLIQNNSKYYIQINELATGDFHSVIVKNIKNSKILFNAIAQNYIAIMFFHKFIDASHNDTHNGNFLYHKIKPGGYFHYNIFGNDYYIENIGYLWIIWDFGSIKPFTNNKFGNYISTNTTRDYSKLIRKLYQHTELFNDDFSQFIKIIMNDLLLNAKYNKPSSPKLLRKLEIELLHYMDLYIPTFTTIKPSNIINKKPYII